MKKNVHLSGFAAGAALGVLLVPHPSNAASVNDYRQTTSLAASIVGDAHDARTALADGHDGDASSDIAKALADRTQLAKLAQAEGLREVVPVYAELDDTTLLSQVAKEKANASKAGESHSLVVRNNTAEITYLAIDLDKTRARLEAASQALDAHNVQAAKDSLAAVDSDFIVDSDVVDMPLLTAREDLALAGKALKMKDDALASADLKQAAQSLRHYTDSSHSGDAQRLAESITATPLHANADPSVISKIDSWWSSVQGWFAQHA